MFSLRLPSAFSIIVLIIVPIVVPPNSRHTPLFPRCSFRLTRFVPVFSNSTLPHQPPHMTPSVLPCLLRSPLLAPSPRTITSLGVSSPLVFHCFAEAKKLAVPYLFSLSLVGSVWASLRLTLLAIFHCAASWPTRLRRQQQSPDTRLQWHNNMFSRGVSHSSLKKGEKHQAAPIYGRPKRKNFYARAASAPLARSPCLNSNDSHVFLADGAFHRHPIAAAALVSTTNVRVPLEQPRQCQKPA